MRSRRRLSDAGGAVPLSLTQLVPNPATREHTPEAINEDVMTALDMGPNEVQSVLSAADQITSDRAYGSVADANITEDYIRDLVQEFRDRIDQNRPPFQDDLNTDHLDVTA